MSSIGPTRLVLIGAGKFHYAEVQLDEPVHLIGANNVGKTSLIATLQFLYIDQQRHMHFVRSLSETRRYYFPDPDAYVLFECLTPTGYRVYGVRGLGPVKQHEFERFAYSGKYDRAHFVDKSRRVRPVEDVRARLADRSFARIRQRDLRGALTGIGEDGGVRLELAPLRHRDHYPRFRTLFRNLLHLAHLRQDALKGSLIDIYRAEFQQPEIDLDRDYADKHAAVQTGTRDLQDMRRIEDEAKEVLGHADRRDTLRKELPALWRALRSTYGRVDAAIAEDLARFEAEKGSNEAERARIGAELKRVATETATANRTLGEVHAKLKRLDELEREFENFLPEFEEAASSALDEKIDGLTLRLRDARQEPLDQLKRRIAGLERECEAKQELLTKLEETIGARLVREFRIEDLGQLARILRPALLGIRVDGDATRIEDMTALRARLQPLLDRLEEDTYKDNFGDVVLPPEDREMLAGYLEPEVIRSQLEQTKGRLAHAQDTLDAARTQDQLSKLRASLRQQRDECRRRLDRFKELEKLRDEVGQWREEQERIEAQLQEFKAAAAELERGREALTKRGVAVDAQIQEANERRRHLEETVARLRPPSADWPQVAHPAIDEMEDLDEILTRYQDRANAEAAAAKEVHRGLQRIHNVTYERFDRGSEPETLKALAGELEAIEEKEQAVGRLWKGLVVSLTKAFKAIQQDFDTLKSKVDSLNRGLAKVSVSNLSRLKLIVRPHSEWLRRIRTITESQELPLFTSPDAVENALKDVGDLLRKYPRVALLDLFDLRFEIETPDGKTRVYQHLDTIESHGTTVTIKVLIHIMLLRDLLGRDDVRIPFYLDEAASLDPENLRGIVNVSRDLGFIPVLASPEALEAATNLYFLTEENNRVTLEPETSLLRIGPDDAVDTREVAGEARGR